VSAEESLGSGAFRKKLLAAFAAITSPLIAGLLVREVVHGHAEKEYFEAVSQILPVILLALVIEQRIFSQRQTAPEMRIVLKVGKRASEFSLARFYARMARIYALLVLALLGLGEATAVEVLATGSSTNADLANTAGSLAAGFTALIVTALVGTKQSAE
jgi:hypothetical protein